MAKADVTRIERGRGTQRIVELCLRAGHSEPIFEGLAGSVVVRFILGESRVLE
jgi:hypothetical protein